MSESKQVTAHAQSEQDGTLAHDVVVIGAGFSGINAGIRLKREGIHDFVILERADDVGGTWRDNTYPGCGCDVPSHLYSYSFEQNPDWSRMYSGAAEIQAYIRRCADKYDMGAHLRFGVEIVRAVFEGSVWRLTDGNGTIHTARAVVSAVGGLVEPSTPEFAGRADFTGNVLHTARWDHGVELAGKKVVVIGTGASAIQLVPAITDKVAQLTVIQRSAPYVLPKINRTLPAWLKRLFARLPFVQTLFRRLLQTVIDVVVGPAIIWNSPLSTGMQKLARRHMRSAIAEPILREKLAPDYEIGCKRVLFASDYYPALTREHVHLETTALERFTKNGIRLADGREIDADVIVTATGYRIRIAEPPFPIVGPDGETLTEKWQGPGGKAYKGVAAAGVPNWFFMLGPNTGPGHTSVLIYTEAQARYISKAIRTLFDKNLAAITVRPAVLRRWHEKLQKRMRHTSWTSGCNSWYVDKNGENHTLFPGLATEYALKIRRFRLSEYELTP